MQKRLVKAELLKHGGTTFPLRSKTTRVSLLYKTEFKIKPDH